MAVQAVPGPFDFVPVIPFEEILSPRASLKVTDADSIGPRSETAARIPKPGALPLIYTEEH
jgi:hypothetical protein